MGGAGRRTRDLRTLVLAVVLLGAWALVGVRLFEVQVVRADELEELALRQRLTREVLAPRRGGIFDRSGQVLAYTFEATTLYANPREIADPTEAALAVAAALGEPAERFEERLRSDSGFVYLRRQLEGAAAEAVKALDIPGIYTVSEPARAYPTGSAAAHVIGFVDIDGNGLEGLEYGLDDALRGRSGFIQYEQSRGVQIPHGVEDRVDAVPGTDLITTIDLSIQYAAETACNATVDRTGAKRCSIVVLDPATGEILAMVVTPGYDPHDRRDVPADRFHNLAVRSLHEPGSTMKLVTIAAALEAGVVTPDTIFEVPRSIEFIDVTRDQPWTFSDAARTSTEFLSVADIVTLSSNVGTLLIAEELGFERHRDALTAFGFGRASGVDFPGEAVVSVNLEPTCITCGASVAIGYSVSTTLVQMASVYGAIANDGVWVQPHLVAATERAGDLRLVDPERREVVSTSTAATMRALLRNVVEADDGTGRSARIHGYDVGGKTGTSRVFEDGRYHEDRLIASFIGMAPVENPRLVVAVLVEEPQGDERSGGLTAAPTFADIMLKALHLIGVEPGG